MYSKKAIALALSYLIVISSLSGLVFVKAITKGKILMDFRHGECNGRVIDDDTLPYSIAELLRDDDYAGYIVDENYDNWLNEIDLSKYDALLIVSPWGWGPKLEGFYSEELDAITNYVQNGGGLLLTVDTQMYYENNVPNQVAGLFGVTFFGDFQSYEYIVNFEHPITRDKKQEDLFNDFLYFDAAILSYPSDAVILVDVLDRDSPSNSSLYGALRASESSGSLYPAMIALEYGNGRAVFGPMNGLTQPWGTALYDRDEPNKMLLNSIEWLVGIAKIKILEAEDVIYRASKAAIETIIDQMKYMAREVAADISGYVYDDVLGRTLDLIPDAFGDMVPTDPKYDDLRKASDDCYEDFMGLIVQTASGNPLEKIAGDIMEGYIDNTLRSTDGLTFEEALEDGHTQFISSKFPLKITDDVLNKISADMIGVAENIKTFPKFILDYRAKFDQVEMWQDVGTSTRFILIIGGTFLLFAAAPSGMATLPFAIAAFQTAHGITYLEWGSEAAEAMFLTMLYREVFESAYKVLNTYDGELVKVMDVVEGKTVGGTLPIPKVDLTDAYSPEEVTLCSIATFGGRIANTGDYDEAARLVVDIKGPSQTWYGPFYSDTKAIEIGQSEDFYVDVPFAPFYFSPGSYGVQIRVECGIPLYSPQLGVHPPPVYRSLNVVRPSYNFYKSVVISTSSSADVTVLLRVRNLSGSDDTITITDTIPKELASSVNDIKFVTQPDEIVEADPVVRWSLDLSAGASAEIVYRVHTSLSPEEVEWLIPAATLRSPQGPDQSSLITIGDKETITEDMDALLLHLKGMINGLPGDSFNGGEQQADAAKLVLSGRIEGVRQSIQNGDPVGALSNYVDLFAPTTGGEPSIGHWITDGDAQFTILSSFDDTASLMRLILLAREDVLPPTTAIALSGTQGADGWYVSDVTVSLPSGDDEFGYGVAETEYSLDGGEEWNAYSGPFAVVSEGTTTISYRSVDNAGNIEEAKQLVVKIDKTHPEALIMFDRTANKVIIRGTDNVDGNVQVLVDSIDNHGKTETFMYELLDDAGNEMEMTCERTSMEDKGSDRLSSVRVLEIRYNDGDPIKPVGNDYEAKFVLDKKTGELKHLTCKIHIGDMAIMSKYNGEKDESTMTLKDGGEKEEKVTLRGLTIVELMTDSGMIEYRY